MPTLLDISDTLRNPTSIDRDLNGQQVGDTAYIWSPNAGFIQRGAEPKRVQQTGVNQSELVSTAPGVPLNVLGKNIMVQAPVIIDGTDNNIYGCNMIIAAGSFSGRLYKAGGIYYAQHTVNAPKPLPVLTPNNTYCARLIWRRDLAMLELWVAVIDEAINPNKSFDLIDTQTGVGGITAPNVGIYNTVVDATGGFMCPPYANATYPFPWRAAAWTEPFTFTPSQPYPHGNGWILSNLFDLSLSHSYSVLLPNQAQQFDVNFTQLEFNNIGNSQDVTVFVGARKFPVPAGRVVTTNIAAGQYQTVIVQGTGGSLLFNAYTANVQIDYNIIN